MKNINTHIRLDVKRLNRPLDTLTPAQLCAYRLEVSNVPDDIVEAFVCVFSPEGGHYAPFPLSQDGNGDWYCELPPTYFPIVGSARYELFGSAESGARTPLGFGEVRVGPFYSGSMPIPTGTVIQISEIPDEQGRMHRIVAKNVGTQEKPDWTSQVEI